MTKDSIIPVELQIVKKKSDGTDSLWFVSRRPLYSYYIDEAGEDHVRKISIVKNVLVMYMSAEMESRYMGNREDTYRWRYQDGGFHLLGFTRINSGNCNDYSWITKAADNYSKAKECLSRGHITPPANYINASFFLGYPMSTIPSCPKCSSEFTYEDGLNYLCPECAHEWPIANDNEAETALIVRDAFGTTLSDGDTITITKDLKVKGFALAIKVGTKVKNIRLAQGDHNIDCKIEGFGAMCLKSEFVKKV